MKDGTERESREPLKEVLVIFQQVALNDSYPKHILKSVMPSLCPFGQEVKKMSNLQGFKYRWCWGGHMCWVLSATGSLGACEPSRNVPELESRDNFISPKCMLCIRSMVHASVSSDAAGKPLDCKYTALKLGKSHSNLFSLILGPRQGQSFSSHTCLCVPLFFKATYSNCSYRRTGMERTYQWGLGSLGDIVVGDEEYTTQSRRKFWVFSILLHINRYVYPWFKAIVDHYLE